MNVVSIGQIPFEPGAPICSKLSPAKKTDSNEKNLSEVKPTSFKDHLWITSGTTLGLILGGIAKYMPNELSGISTYIGNILKTSGRGRAPFDNFTSYHHINDILNTINRTREEFFKNVSPPVYNPFIPLLCSVPVAAFSVWNMSQEKRMVEDDKTPFALAKRRWRHFSKEFFIPLLYTNSMTIGGLLFRHAIHLKLNKIFNTRIDVSGHMIGQAALAVYGIKTLQGLEQTGKPWQKKAVAALHIALAVTDVVWVYHTARNCHSIPDVVSALACSALAFSCIETGKFILNKGFEWTKPRIIKLFFNYKIKLP